MWLVRCGHCCDVICHVVHFSVMFWFWVVFVFAFLICLIRIFPCNDFSFYFLKDLFI